MNKKRLKKLLNISLVFLMIFSCFGAIMKTNNVSATEEFQLQDSVKTNKEKTQSDITLDVQNINAMYTIESIVNPDGSTMDLKNPVYTVEKNGTYEFKVSYRHQQDENQEQEEEEEQKTYTKTVKITDLTKTTDTSKALLPKISTSPSGDSLSVQFNRTNGTSLDWTSVGILDWSYVNTEQIEITANFSNQGSSKTRKIEIDIPHGYSVLGYSAKDPSQPAQAGEQLFSTTTATNQAMISSALTAQNGSGFGSQKSANPYINIGNGGPLNIYYKSGKIVYEFNSQADTIILTLQVGI